MLAVSRPYARAVFEYAQAAHRLSEWSQLLQLVASVVQDPSVKKIVSNPSVDQNKLASLMIDAITPLPVGGDNFIWLLAQRKRLLLLAPIATLFAHYYADAQNTLAVDVTTATALTEVQKQNLAMALQRHFNKTIHMQAHLDRRLLGGALIYAGDLMIDASIKTTLLNLEKQMI